MKTPDAILDLDLELAAKLRKSSRAVEPAVRRLRASSRLARIGPDKGGYWKVID